MSLARRYAAWLLGSLLVVVLSVGGCSASQPPLPGRDAAFPAWLETLKQEARAAGISDRTLDATLSDAKLLPRVVELDRRQPEFTQTFWRYLERAVTEQRVERGKRMLHEHRELLDRISREYGVQPRFLVAFWGLESNFGDNFGGFPVIDALVTLAYDPRRSTFFRKQLLDALMIVEKGHIAPDQMIGSWAGAMGHLQFIPSTFLHYAVDGNGDGRRDIWNSLPDVFASAANYLAKIGWRGDQTWGRQVALPPDFDIALASLEVRKPVNEWQRLGVRGVEGGDLPEAELSASIILPSGYQGPAFIVYENFHTILRWNRSILYAIAVGHLADRLIGHPPLAGARPEAETPLSRQMVIEMQELLLARGFELGSPDGMVGPATRAAIRAYQRSLNLPPDGFPTTELLERLRRG